MILWLQALCILAGLLTASLIIARLVVRLESKDDRGEGWLKKYLGIDATTDMSAWEYLGCLLLLTAIGATWVAFVAMNQSWLPMNPQHRVGLDLLSAAYLGVASSTPTNLLPFAAENGLSPFTQTFAVSPANIIVGCVGIATWRALARALQRKSIGNAWGSIWRGMIIILPLQLLFGFVLVWQGVAQDPFGPTLAQSTVASFTSNSIVSGSGSGIVSDNSASAIANPTYKTDLAGLLALIALPMGLWLATGIMARQQKLTERIALVMTLTLVAASIGTYLMMPPSAAPIHWEASQALWPNASAGSSNGSVNETVERYGKAGILPTFFILMGSVPFPPPVGVGVGTLMFLLVMAIFITSLVTGKSPVFLGFGIKRTEIAIISAGIIGPTLLTLSAIAFVMWHPAFMAMVARDGAHGVSAIIYALASITQNNGSCYVYDLTHPLWTQLGFFLIIGGRFLYLAPVVLFAGALAAQRSNPPLRPSVDPSSATVLSVWLLSILVGAIVTLLPVMLMGPVLEALR